MGQYHLTALNCSEYDGHKVAAQKACGVPARLLEPVRMPPEAVEAVAHMYERYDGKGFPDGIGGKDIPLGARVLAICDTYADLTQNPRNPFRKTLSPQEACAALAKLQGHDLRPEPGRRLPQHRARRGAHGAAPRDARRRRSSSTSIRRRRRSSSSG